jgi:hypothetical protein
VIKNITLGANAAAKAKAEDDVTAEMEALKQKLVASELKYKTKKAEWKEQEKVLKAAIAAFSSKVMGTVSPSSNQ